MNLLDVIKTKDYTKEITASPEFKKIKDIQATEDKYAAQISAIVEKIKQEKNIDTKSRKKMTTKFDQIKSELSYNSVTAKTDSANKLFSDFLFYDTTGSEYLNSASSRITALPKTTLGTIKELADKFKMVILPIEYSTSFTKNISNDQLRSFLGFLGDSYKSNHTPYILAPIEYYDHWKHLNCISIDQWSYFPECYQMLKMSLDTQLISMKNLLIMNNNLGKDLSDVKNNVQSMQATLKQFDERIMTLEKKEAIRVAEEKKLIEKKAKEELMKKAMINKDPLVFSIPKCSHQVNNFNSYPSPRIIKTSSYDSLGINDDTITPINICFGEDFDPIFAHFYGLTHYKDNRKTIEDNINSIYKDVKEDSFDKRLLQYLS